MPRVHVTGRNGEVSEIDVLVDTPLMYALRDAGLPVEGTCGGYASCGSCHIYVDDEWREKLDEKASVESDMLDLLQSVDPVRSRLSCQIIAKDELDGLTIMLAPEE